jgi:NAD+ synthase (glutamine-hydrolysing)
LGSISKNDAKAFQRWARDIWDLPILTEFIEATPTAELLPLSAGVQDDESEQEMGMTYEELSVFGVSCIAQVWIVSMLMRYLDSEEG